MAPLLRCLVFVVALPPWVWASSAQDGHDVDETAAQHVNSPDTGVQAAPRVRATSPAITAAIQLLMDRSPTFQLLVTTINSTDGIVYVHQGTCPHKVRACLLLWVTQAGPNRILHIKVDGRKTENDLPVAIGHELQHAIEVLSERRVIDSHTARLFYEREFPTDKDFHETQAAIQTELDIVKDLRKWAKKRGRHEGARAGGGVMR
jgi:hypothetical protein